MKTLLALIIYYEAAHYNPVVYEYAKQEFEIIETLGDGYEIRQEEKIEEESIEKKEEEIINYLIFRMMCEPFCI